MKILVALLSSAFASGAFAAPVKTFTPKPFPFVDEAAKDPSFVKFREKLRETVKNKNVKELLAAIDPKIKNSFGGVDGVEEFKTSWKLNKPETSPIWHTLEELLNMGGTFLEKRFTAPYVFSNWPEDYDAFDYLAVVKDGAPLREKAEEKSTVLRPLQLEIVRRISTGFDIPWIQVLTAEGKTGWVSSKQVWSPVDFRAFFAKKNGAWKLTTLVAGD